MNSPTSDLGVGFGGCDKRRDYQPISVIFHSNHCCSTVLRVAIYLKCSPEDLVLSSDSQRPKVSCLYSSRAQRSILATSRPAIEKRYGKGGVLLWLRWTKYFSIGNWLKRSDEG